jgi:hypothetical protein
MDIFRINQDGILEDVAKEPDNGIILHESLMRSI